MSAYLRRASRRQAAAVAAMAATAEAAAKHLAATTTIGTSDARDATGVIAVVEPKRGSSCAWQQRRASSGLTTAAGTTQR